MEKRRGRTALVLLGLALAGCQSAGGEVTTAAPEATPPVQQTAFAAAAGQTRASPAQCAAAIAGPPPKPARGSDFASATGRNLGRNVGRNLIAGIGGQIAGPLGGAVARGVATEAIRSEQDLKGAWSATDGSADCGCTLDIQSGVNLAGRTVHSGSLSARDCANPLLARAARWNLGHTFTGYDASFDLTAADGTRLASLKRDGVHYFSGALADGTPVVIWRE